MKAKIDRFLYNNKFIVIINNRIAYLDLDIPTSLTLDRRIEYRNVKTNIDDIEIIKILLCKTQYKNYICGVLIRGENLNREIILKNYNQLLEAVKIVI